MTKYLDLSAHHEVTLDELLGKKAVNTKPEHPKENPAEKPKDSEAKKK